MTNTSSGIESFPLSPIQRGMLFHHLEDPRSGVDIEQLVVQLPEKVDVPRLRSAWNWLVGRHDVLRTQFVWDNVDQPQQEILPAVSVPFVVKDCSDLDQSAHSAELANFLEVDRVRGFDMGRGPLFRLTLFRWNEASFTLVWTFHHALADGRSYVRLLREVFEAYQELETGKVAERPEPPAFRRHIDWLQQQKVPEAESFWKHQLQGFTSPTPLVVDELLDSQYSEFRHGEVWRHVDGETTRILHKIAEAHDLTMNSIVMGAWAILLHRYCGEEDILFGATRACRKSSVPGADEIVGTLINTVPIRVKFTGGTSALSVCRDVRQTWLAVRPFEHTPLAQVRALSEVPPGLPLFETLVVFENYRLDEAMRSVGGAWSHRSVDLHELTNYPITLAAYNGKELSFKIEFDRRRLSSATIQRLLDHLATLLAAIAADPTRSAGELRLLSEAEYKQITAEWNTTDVVYEQGQLCLHKIFEAQAAKTPQAAALRFRDKEISYSELNQLTNQLAHALRLRGVTTETPVAVCAERSIEMVVALLGILKAGGAYVPLDPEYPAERLEYLLKDLGQPLVLTQEKFVACLPRGQKTVLLDREWSQITAQPSENPALRTGPRNAAYVIYTSGSTGAPKAVVNIHEGIVNRLLWMQDAYGIGPGDRVLQKTPYTFDVSVWEFFWPLMTGACLVVAEPGGHRDPSYLVKVIGQELITTLHFVPSMLDAFLDASGLEQLVSVRRVFCSGEALPYATQMRFFARMAHTELHNLYGPTEASVDVTYWACCKGSPYTFVPIGKPIANTRIYVLDRHRNPVPIGVPGELYIGGVGVARGYLNREELTAERFLPDPFSEKANEKLYRTGDLVRLLADGNIEYLSRTDHQVKIRGFRIELGEIESALRLHPAVREAAVVAREESSGTKRLVAYCVVSDRGYEVSGLREYLKKKLPEYMIPAAFVSLEKLPISANGKLDRKALPVPEHRPELSVRYLPPRTTVEHTLATIWSKVLRVERVGVNDNFFELGGDSILSIQVLSLVRRAGLELTPKLLFANQTVAELAAAVGQVERKSPTPNDAVGDVPLTPIQRWFFEQDLAEAHHYNQAFLFQAVERLDRATLEEALRQLSLHHDSLRLRYVREATGWRQSYAVPGEPPSLHWVDIGNLEPVEQQRRIESEATALQAGLNLQAGPTWQAAYFDAGPRGTGRLLIIVHHLAVDGVSWRFLVDDLETAYEQLKAGRSVQLPDKTSSYGCWAKQLQDLAVGESLQGEIPYWEEIAEAVSQTAQVTVDNVEGASRTLKTELSIPETSALLQDVPRAYNTQINDVLLTALVRAWSRWNGSRVLVANIEGHGREHLSDDIDVSRTVGWFTSIFPIRLEVPDTESGWEPGEALNSVKEQLRRIPRRGIGYGVLRYLHGGVGLTGGSEAPILFNYLGQMDQLVAGSKLLRFAKESTGSWHSARQQRRHALEVNLMVVDGALEIRWTFNPGLHPEPEAAKLADEFQAALRELVVHCLRPGVRGRTPSDFPLARLDQATVDRFLLEEPVVEDICPLSPMQTLFQSAHPEPVHLAFDQWHCTLSGDLHLPVFQQAWNETIQRHTILRSTFHAEGLPEPLQVVHENAIPTWRIEDWRAIPLEQQASRWSAFLQQDRSQPLILTQAACMRFALVRTAQDSWKFLWSVPALMLDGWSWPLVFRDARRIYEAHCTQRVAQLDLVRPYSKYLRWLGAQSTEAAREFWTTHLAGFREPTSLPSERVESLEPQDPYGARSFELPEATTKELQAVARELQITVNAILQGAWVILLGRQSGKCDVVFGAAFSGRPAELVGSDVIVGPCTNNLPVRVEADPDKTTGQLLKDIHAHTLALTPFQSTPLIDIQNWSGISWRQRLFESLIVFQNYRVDDATSTFGNQIRITDFEGPIHTNYRLTLVVKPGASLAVKLIYQRSSVAGSAVDRWIGDLQILLSHIPAFLMRPLADLQSLLSLPSASVSVTRPERRTKLQNSIPPQNDMERIIASVWRDTFGLDEVGSEENLFDLGGHSLLLVQLHGRLRDALQRDFPILTLFEYPTVRALAGHFSANTSDSSMHTVDPTSEQWRDRVRRRKVALAELRTKSNRVRP